MKDNAEHRVNIITGVATLALVALVVILAAGRAVLGLMPAPSGTPFVAYFDESAGLRAGHQVRMIGRRAGIVTAVDMATVDGRAKVRVEFELRPGEGLEWVDRLPADTQALIQPGGMRSAPRLVLTQGVSVESIPAGGEVPSKSEDARDDALTTYRRNLQEIDEMIDKAAAIIEGPDVAKVISTVRLVGEKLAQAEPRIDELAAGAPNVIASMSKLREDLDAARASVGDAKGAAEAALGSSAGATERLDGQLEGLEARVRGVDESLGGLVSSVEAAAKGLDARGAADLGLQLRVLAARLRASQEMASRDPALFGDLPPRRYWRPYFSGDEFRPGDNSDKGR